VKSALTRHFEYLTSELRKLSLAQRIAFAAASAERLVPLYVRFSREAAWGDAGVLARAVQEAWKAAQAEHVDHEKMRDLIRLCELAAPDTEDFHSPFTSAALSASGAACAALRCALSGDECEDAATMVTDAIYLTLAGRARRVRQLKPTRSLGTRFLTSELRSNVWQPESLPRHFETRQLRGVPQSQPRSTRS